MYKQIIIIGNSLKIKLKEFYLDLINSADLVICADGGANHAHNLGIIPETIIGDCDSIEPAVYDYFKNQGCQIIKLVHDKDKTDMQLAIEHALSLKPDRLIIIGAIGGRPDHTLANINLLAKPGEVGVKAKIVSEDCTLWLLSSGDKLELETEPGDIVSLIPLTPQVDGVFTRGLKCPLSNAELYSTDSRGISNKVVSLPVVVKVGAGRLLAIKLRN